MTRTRPCPPEVRHGRLRKATQFLDAANLAWDFAEDDIADAYITLCVHAGIAAADVICCARLGEHSQTENHNEAAAHLGKADRDSVKHLRTLLGMKTKAGYSHAPATTAECRRAAEPPRRCSRQPVACTPRELPERHLPSLGALPIGSQVGSQRDGNQ